MNNVKYFAYLMGKDHKTLPAIEIDANDDNEAKAKTLELAKNRSDCIGYITCKHIGNMRREWI